MREETKIFILSLFTKQKAWIRRKEFNFKSIFELPRSQDEKGNNLVAYTV